MGIRIGTENSDSGSDKNADIRKRVYQNTIENVGNMKEQANKNGITYVLEISVV